MILKQLLVMLIQMSVQPTHFLSKTSATTQECGNSSAVQRNMGQFLFDPFARLLFISCILLAFRVNADAQVAVPTLSIAAHEKSISSITFSNNGKYFATTGNDNHLKIWASTDKTLKYNLSALFANCAAFSPDDNFVACGGDDGKVRIYDMETGNKKGDIAVEGVIRELLYTPKELIIRTGLRIYVYESSMPFNLRIVLDGELPTQVGSSGGPDKIEAFKPRGMFMAPDGQLIVSALQSSCPLFTGASDETLDTAIYHERPAIIFGSSSL